MRTAIIAVFLSSLFAAPIFACGMDNAREMPTVATIDRNLSGANLSSAERTKVGQVRERMAGFIAAGDIGQARDAEAEAMRILGLERVWLRCGKGSFVWGRHGAK
jgi:hypothetical protein